MRPDLRVRMENPYQLKTKGEMLRECKDQKTLKLMPQRGRAAVALSSLDTSIVVDVCHASCDAPLSWHG